MTPEEKMQWAFSKEGMTFARDYLSQIQCMDAAISLKLARLDNIREKGKKITHLMESLPGQGVGDPVGEAAAQTADLEKELLDDYRALMEKQKAIQNTIRRVPDKTQRMVLEMRYLESMPFFRIAMQLSYDERTIYRFHHKALQQTALQLMEAADKEDV